MPDQAFSMRPEDFAKAMPFGFIVDAEGRLVTLGAALRRCLGVAVGALADEHLAIVRPPRTASLRDVARNPAATVVLRARHGTLQLKGCLVTANRGERATFLGAPVVRDIGEFKQLGLSLADFSPADATPDLLMSMQATRAALADARQLSEELRAALTEAQAATEAKARFLATMSHEIRTPLNGFGSMIDLLRDSGLGDEQRAQLDTMDACAQTLLTLVGDVLDFSKIEAGRIEIAPRPTLVCNVVSQAVANFRALAEERGVQLGMNCCCNGVHWVAIDPERTRQVLANLIGNAIKFTSEGRVDVALETTGGRLVVDVVDTGVGIPEASRGRMFEPFMQADSSTTRRFGGTGLGLAISRQLARAMGGDVELVRSDATGSHFRFSAHAPAAAPPVVATAAPAARAPERFDGLRVLVVDDDATNQVIAQRLLGKLGAEATVVGDGMAAVEAAQNGAYDLILMDLMMPVMGGIEAAQRIRASTGQSKAAPIVAFSASTFASDHAAAQAAGMNGFLEKPVRLAGVRDVLRQFVRPR